MENEEKEKISTETTTPKAEIPEEKEVVEEKKPLVEEKKTEIVLPEKKVDLPEEKKEVEEPKVEEEKEEAPVEEKTEEKVEKAPAEEPKEEPKPEEKPEEKPEDKPEEKTEEEPKAPEVPSKEEEKEEPPTEDKPEKAKPKEEEKTVEKEEPAIVIPEEKEDKKVQGKEMEAADFTAMFNVASEETPEEPKAPEIPSKEKEEEKEEPSENKEIIEQAIVIPEEKEDVKIQGKEMEAADFTAMFNVASEETPEQKAPAKEAPKIEVDAASKEAAAKQEATEVKLEQPTVITQPTPEELAARKTSKFNSEEKTLYTIKEDKESNPIGVILFFVILAVVVVFLPQLTKTSEAALDKLYGKPQVSTEGENEEKVESKYYYFEQTMDFKLDNLTIDNAVKSKTGDEYFLTMTVFNNDNKAYYYDKNYYIFLYNDNQVLSRTKFFSYIPVAPNGANEVSFVINKGAKESANRFAFVLVDKNEYPDFNITTVEDGYKVLTCSYLNDELKYYFKDDKLTKIKEVYKEQKTDNNFYYEKNKAAYKELSEGKYKPIEHFESNFIDRHAISDEVPEEFEMVNNLDLVNINDKELANLRTYKFFSYNESKNVVAYEAASMGYTCGN